MDVEDERLNVALWMTPPLSTGLQCHHDTPLDRTSSLDFKIKDRRRESHSGDSGDIGAENGVEIAHLGIETGEVGMERSARKRPRITSEPFGLRLRAPDRVSEEPKEPRDSHRL